MIAAVAAASVPALASPVAHGTAQATDFETVLRSQPQLAFSAESADRPYEVRYCTVETPQHTYITYIYVWDFSTSPGLSDALGYRSHPWDFEPVTVRAAIGSGEVEFAYDAGHYRAETTQPTTLYVDRSSHRYIASSGLSGETQSADMFSPVTESSLEEMNRLLAGIARLPFGPGLSLDWACSNPAKVFESGYFSSDEAIRTVLPPQVMLLISGAAAVLLAPVYALALWALRKAGTGVRPATAGSVLAAFLLAIAAVMLPALAAGTVYVALTVSLLIVATCFTVSRAVGTWWKTRNSRGAVFPRLLRYPGDAGTAVFAVIVACVTYLVF